jgi:hypothetical protein
MDGNYKRLITLDINLGIRSIQHEDPIIIGGYKIKTSGPRLRTFLKGTTCVKCGLAAAFFAVESTKPHYQNFHLNLYGFGVTGNEVLMTSDHIRPKALGGGGQLSNRQPMCIHCNFKKGANPD